MIRKSIYTVAVVVSLGLTSSACSSDEPAKPAPSKAAPVSPVAEEVTREQGAEKYLSLVKPFNEALGKCTEVMNPLMDSQASSPEDFPKLQAACKSMPEANRKFADELAKAKWPAEAQESISLLVDEVRVDQLAWQEVSEAKTHEDLFNPDHPLSEDGPAAGLVRAHLGLPPVEEIEE